MKTKTLARTLALLALLSTLNLQLSTAFAQINWGNFILASSPPVGLKPIALTAADVNRDGKVDLISANQGDGTLSVLTNTGQGFFGQAATLSVGGGAPPWCLTAADVNNDGKVDLLCPTANTLWVLTNDGSGGFALASTNVSGALTIASSITAADLNGDGKVDVSIASWAGTLSVMTNDGNGGFVLASLLGVGPFPYSVTAADVNGDGKVDLISANWDDGTLSVLTNDGSGGFVLASTLAVGENQYSSPTWVTTADVDGNGKVDLICALGGEAKLWVLTNNGSGGFALASAPAVNNGTYAVAAAEVNGDGKVDLISANGQAPGTLSVLTNDGTGGFALAARPAVGRSPMDVTAADVNNDGKVDLISANYDAKTLSVLFNGLPTLGIGTIGGQIALFWTAWATNCFVESTTNLADPNWTPAVTSGVIIGVTVSNALPAQYFRISQW